jgi:hypothetical protein
MTYRWIYIFTWLLTDSEHSPEQAVELMMEVIDVVYA